jgi:hypothetical protein
LRLPNAQFDTGCLSVNQTDILLFGGFIDKPLDTIYIYRNTDPKAEGEILNA